MPLQQYKLPDLLALWPWPRTMNPHYEEVKLGSSAWVGSFKLFGPKDQKAFLDCNFDLLASLVFPNRSKAFLRAACDLMNFYFVYDEFSDVADKGKAQNMADIVRDALKNPKTPGPPDDVIGELTRQFWNQALSLTDPSSPCINRFIVAFDDYTAAVAQEADDRNHNRIRSVNDYLALRFDTTSMKAVFSLSEFGLNLPDEVIQHPVISRLTHNAVILCAVSNDMHSYSVEHARGLAGHNMVTSIIHEHNLDLQSALNWMGVYGENIIASFLDDLKKVPSWGPTIDANVKVYIDTLGNWVRGNDVWSYESKRYYGDDGERVRETRLITLREPEKGYLKEEQLKRAILDSGKGPNSAPLATRSLNVSH